MVQVYCELEIPEYTAQLTMLISKESMMPGTLDMKDIWYNGGMMLLYTFGSLIAMGIVGLLNTRVAPDWAFSLCHALMAKVTTFSNVELNRFTTPSLITRMTNDVVQVQNFIAIGF